MLRLIVQLLLLIAIAIGWIAWRYLSHDVPPDMGALQSALKRINPTEDWKLTILHEAHAGGRDPTDFWMLSTNSSEIARQLDEAAVQNRAGYHIQTLNTEWIAPGPRPAWWPKHPDHGYEWLFDDGIIDFDFGKSGMIYVRFGRAIEVPAFKACESHALRR